VPRPHLPDDWRKQADGESSARHARACWHWSPGVGSGVADAPMCEACEGHAGPVGLRFTIVAHVCRVESAVVIERGSVVFFVARLWTGEIAKSPDIEAFRFGFSESCG
jgi:hypothetical protein